MKYSINNPLKLNIGDTLELANGGVIEVVPDYGYPCSDKCVLGMHECVHLNDGSRLRCAGFDCHPDVDEEGIHLELKV